MTTSFYNIITGTTGNDNLIGTDQQDSITAGNGKDFVEGGAGDDILLGQGHNDIVVGGAGNDLIKGGSGHDYVNGSSGEDTVYGQGGNDSVVGSTGNDILSGGNGNDLVLGQEDNDRINGGGGDDTLIGGLGRDIVTGGAGADLFEFDIPPGNAGGLDIIKDFEPGLDKILVEDIVGRTLNASEFATVDSIASARSSHALIVFNSSNNLLFYNPNGSNNGFGAGGGSIARFNVEIEYLDFVDSDLTRQFNYGEALQKSFLFYEAQRSGELPADNRTPWRVDSAVWDGDVNQDGDFDDVVNGVPEIDLSGGYYDAGDHVKFGLPMTSSMTLLSWGAIEYEDAYRDSGQFDEVLDAIKWGTDYILKTHVSENGETKALYTQVGEARADHNSWGPPENMTMERPIFKVDEQHPGADIAGESAAALASASMVWRSEDSQYADELLENARQLYEFAKHNPGKYSDSIYEDARDYRSYDYVDELSWAANWLYKATGETSYLDDAKEYAQGLSTWTHNWDNKSYGSAVLLAEATTGSDDNARYRVRVEEWLDYWSDDTGSGIEYTEGGLAFLGGWGSLRYAANTAFIASIYSDYLTEYNLDQTKAQQYDQFAQQQIDYILGDNPRNSSYMVGFGENYPQQPHHRAASGATDWNWSGDEQRDPNQYILYGALVGGPASTDDHDYIDDRSDYRRNEVALDYNAGLTGALAWMYDQYGGEPLTDAQIADLPFEQF
ncbi:MAG: glycoside hydrolase family 9 protein [Microcoleaceae cyanobacterium]